MAWETLLFEARDGVGLVTLNRPNAMNSISRALGNELMELLDQCEKDDSIKVLVITGGPKVFSVGADIKELVGIGTMAEAFPLIVAPFAFKRLDAFAKPAIAAVAGMALGGGLEMTLCCDLRVASETAMLGIPETKLGAFPAAGGTQRLPRLVGPAVTKRLIYTGEPITAGEAYRVGLVDFVVPQEDYLKKALELAGVIAERGPLAVRMAKSCINVGMNVDLESGLAYERNVAIYLSKSEDQTEGFRAFAEKRKPVFTGR